MAELQGMRAQSRAREAQELRATERRRAALVIILRHLLDSGYTDTVQRLSTEANLSLSKVDVADNVSLLNILQDYEDSYEARFGQRVKLVRKIRTDAAEDHLPSGLPPVRPPPQRLSCNGRNQPPPGVLSSLPPPAPPISGALAAKQRRDRGLAAAEDIKRADGGSGPGKGARAPSESGQALQPGGASPGQQDEPGVSGGGVVSPPKLHITGAAVPRGSAHDTSGHGDMPGSPDADTFFERRVLKPLPGHLRGELADLSAAITRDIFMENPNVRWDDIAGLDSAKRLLQEAVVLPIKYPQLFTGLLAPWKGVLLYGPPGTGKTLLAKAVATECRTTFFNVHASTIISKWRGDSEKLVRVLFELARHHAPSTIFLDEVDALAGARGGEHEHEASRRMKTELLIQMDGLARSSELVFVLTATNLPWELDLAMLRRLEKRILVPLPSAEARSHMFRTLLAGRCSPDVQWADIAERTQGYSGSDVMLLAKEAAMRPLRRLMSNLDVTTAPARPAPGRAAAAQGGQEASVQVPKLDFVTPEDIDAALTVSKPSARLHEARYVRFSEEYGQPGT